MPGTIKRRFLQRGIWVLIILSLLAIAWRVADADSKIAEAACLGMFGYLTLFLALVPKRLWNSGA